MAVLSSEKIPKLQNKSSAENDLTSNPKKE